MPDWSHDLVLGALQNLAEPVGSLVRAFPGRAGASEQPTWLEDWFLGLTRRFAHGDGPDTTTIIASAANDGELSLLAKPPVNVAVRLVSVRPHYFRGFRRAELAIRLDADLVVIEGRNSSGKTSLSEAIEWVFTGQLSRRTSGEQGHPTELADCIGNEFRPDGESTRVDLTLEVDGSPRVLTRELRHDYSSSATDLAESTLFVDGLALSPHEERDLRERLLAGVHPILMQHTLRRFVHDDPNSRRQYFERLLQIDEFTSLIEKAVIGTAGIKQLPNPDGGIGLPALRNLGQELERFGAGQHSGLVNDLKKLERLPGERVPGALQVTLARVAHALFESECATDSDLATCRERLSEAQRAQREARLPLLAPLEAARSQALPPASSLCNDIALLDAAMGELANAQESIAGVSATSQELARLTEHLLASGVLDASGPTQTCPMCECAPPTLTRDRIRQLTSWAPLAKAIAGAQQAVRERRTRISAETTRIRQALTSSLPNLPGTPDVQRQLQGASPHVVALVEACLHSAARAHSVAAQADDALQRFVKAVASEIISSTELNERLLQCDTALAELAPILAGHRDDVTHLEEAVGASSRDDATYRLRERWLEVAGLTSAVAADIGWEHSKVKAKTALDGLRTGLISLRTAIIEHARVTFSKEMTAIWHLLRSDSGARFSALTIPAARGKGYKLEFELKAIISDGQSEPVVDALRVFSESQVNVVGVAAYVTRARLLGHRFLIFDDPVQSMDEEHFRTFATKLLPDLIDEGFQVVILTHSDTFARRIHDHHYQRSSYATLEMQPSKRKGCFANEGCRRVSERLHNARRLASEGDLQGAWRLIRMAIERMYTLAYARETPGFDPESWRNMTAEDMWERGVGAIMQAKAPRSAARLREILTATAAGAHDKAPTSETDVVDACKDLAALLSPLRLGGG